MAEVVWEGDLSGVSQGPWTVDGTTVFTSSPNPFSSIQSLGNTASNTATASLDPTKSRNGRTSKSLKIVMAPGSQRCQFVSRDAAAPLDGRWTPDALGTEDLWYGVSIWYDGDWGDEATLASEISGTVWHDPIAFRTAGANGSMNVSGDSNDDDGTGPITSPTSTPRTFYLRRNTVKDGEGFYSALDGQGLDKIPMGQVVTGQWMDFVFHIRWDTTNGNALREVWRDGVFMGSKTTANAVDTQRHDFRLGIYQATTITHNRTVWYDNMRIGTSYAMVDPSLGGATSGSWSSPSTVQTTARAVALAGSGTLAASGGLGASLVTVGPWSVPRSVNTDVAPPPPVIGLWSLPDTVSTILPAVWYGKSLTGWKPLNPSGL